MQNNKKMRLPHFRMILLVFCVFCLMSSVNCYVGVQRYFNGTDIEFYKIKSDGACEKEFAGRSWFRPTNSNLCGYPCLPNGNRAASVYKNRSQSTACQYDYEIMDEEKCLVNIGNISKTDAIQTVETSSFGTADLHESANNSLTRLSSCHLRESGCSVKYRNITSQWQPFRHFNCFKFKVEADGHIAVAQVTIDCLEKEKPTLSGQMFRIELTCRIDEQNRTFNSCLLFKVSGTYIEKSGTSQISTGCMVPPVIPTNPTSPVTRTTRTTVIKNGDNYDDDEVFFEPFVWVIIALVFFPILLLVAIVIYVKCHGKCRCRKKKNYEIGINNEQNALELTTEGLSPAFNGQKPKPTYNKNAEHVTVIDEEGYQTIGGSDEESSSVKNLPDDASHAFVNPLFENDESLKTEKPAVTYAQVEKHKVEENKEDGKNHPVPNEIYEEIPDDKNDAKEYYQIPKTPSISGQSKEILFSDADKSKVKEKKFVHKFVDEDLVDEVIKTDEEVIINLPSDDESEGDYNNNNVQIVDVASVDDRSIDILVNSSDSVDNEKNDSLFETTTILDKNAFWKSKALKRTPSFVIDDNKQTIDDKSTIEKADDNTEDALDLLNEPKRIKSADGTFRKLPINDIMQDAPIYTNSSSVIAAEPLSRYSDIYERETSDDSNSTMKATNEPPAFLDSSSDANDLSTPNDDSDSEGSTHYKSPVPFTPEEKLNESDDKETPPLPVKRGSLVRSIDSHEVYDKPRWPPLAAFSSDASNNNYNYIPQIKGDRKESVTINFRRPVPDEINLTRLSYSQFNYGNRNKKSGNSSCNGFCLSLANAFLQRGKISVSELLTQIPMILAYSEQLWNDLTIGSTTVDEAYPHLKKAGKDDFICNLGEEIFWSIDQGLGGNSPFEALHDLFDMCVNKKHKSCLILTFYPDKSCVCLFEENGTQIFVDGHIHFKTNNQDRKDALLDPECGGVVAIAKKSKCDAMLNFILTNMCLEMKADPKNGTAIPILLESHSKVSDHSFQFI